MQRSQWCLLLLRWLLLHRILLRRVLRGHGLHADRRIGSVLLRRRLISGEVGRRRGRALILCNRILFQRLRLLRGLRVRHRIGASPRVGLLVLLILLLWRVDGSRNVLRRALRKSTRYTQQAK